MFQKVKLGTKEISLTLKAHGIPHTVEGWAVLPYSEDEVCADEALGDIVFVGDETTEDDLFNWLNSLPTKSLDDYIVECGGEASDAETTMRATGFALRSGEINSWLD